MKKKRKRKLTPNVYKQVVQKVLSTLLLLQNPPFPGFIDLS